MCCPYTNETANTRLMYPCGFVCVEWLLKSLVSCVESCALIGCESIFATCLLVCGAYV
jgi:hypothetical protein